MRVARAVVLSEAERDALGRWSRGRSTPARLVLRAQIILSAATGARNGEIARKVGTSCPTVVLWRGRFVQERLAGIE